MHPSVDLLFISLLLCLFFFSTHNPLSHWGHFVCLSQFVDGRCFLVFRKIFKLILISYITDHVPFFVRHRYWRKYVCTKCWYCWHDAPYYPLLNHLQEDKIRFIYKIYVRIFEVLFDVWRMVKFYSWTFEWVMSSPSLVCSSSLLFQAGSSALCDLVGLVTSKFSSLVPSLAS